MIFFGEGSLRNAIREFIEHYHAERNHQGPGNRLIIPLKTPAKTIGTVQSRERLVCNAQLLSRSRVIRAQTVDAK